MLSLTLAGTIFDDHLIVIDTAPRTCHGVALPRSALGGAAASRLVLNFGTRPAPRDVVLRMMFSAIEARLSQKNNNGVLVSASFRS